jgi:repressor LexA
LTQRQNQLLVFIEDYLVEYGYPPSIREMAFHMGIRSTNGVNDHLKALERKGFLVRNSGAKSRAISLVQSSLKKTSSSRSESLSVPVLGHVAAGQPILAQENFSGRLSVDKSLVGASQNVFALEVKGDSMIEKGILNGDYVFVKQQEQADSGQVVVALIDDEATVKIFRPASDHIVFEPANAAMKPIVVRRDENRQTGILGVVVGVYRKLL